MEHIDVSPTHPHSTRSLPFRPRMKHTVRAVQVLQTDLHCPSPPFALPIHTLHRPKPHARVFPYTVHPLLVRQVSPRSRPHTKPPGWSRRPNDICIVFQRRPFFESCADMNVSR